MKPATRDIEPILKAPLKFRGLLLYGPDHGLARQRNAALLPLLTDPNDPFAHTQLRAEQVSEDPAIISDELSALSFGGGRRLVSMSDATDKHTAAIESALSTLHEGNFLLVLADELAARSSLRGLFESHKELVAIPCYHDEGQALEQLVRNTLRGYGLRCHDEVVHYLATHLGGDRMVILSELEKLSLYAGEDEIVSLETVIDVVGENRERSLDDACRAFAGGNSYELARHLDQLALEGVHGVAVMRAVSRYLQRLLQVHGKTAHGTPVDSALMSLRPPVFFKQAPEFKRHLQLWSPTRLQAVLDALLGVEAELKTTHEVAITLAAQRLLQLTAQTKARLAG